jgi:hypothetical protein
MGLLLVGMEVDARWVTGNMAPLPTMIGGELERGVAEEKVPGFEDMCDEAPVSMYHSAGWG